MDAYQDQREFGSEGLSPTVADILKRYSHLNLRFKNEVIK